MLSPEKILTCKDFNKNLTDTKYRLDNRNISSDRFHIHSPLSTATSKKKKEVIIKEGLAPQKRA